jgi:hypothetical protein
MITNALLWIFFTFLASVVSLFPLYSGMPVSFDSALSTITPYLNYINNFFPVDTLWSVLSYLFIFYTGLLSFKILNWIINKVRGSG